MERNTFKITTPSGQEIELKSWLTIGEKKKIDNIMLSKVSMNSVSGNGEVGMNNIDAMIIEEMEKMAFETVIIGLSIDEIYNLPSIDLAFIKSNVDSVVNGENFKKKENS